MSHSSVTTSDGLRLALYARGDPTAPTVVAVHGYPDDHTVWDGVAADLAADHHVITYDVRGAGASGVPRDRAGYHLDQLADDLLAVLDAVAPGRAVHLLAHDWGAIATWHAVTGEGLDGRVASYTSISGPCLDHVGAWFRRRTSTRAVLRQMRASWYTALFRLPVVPELAWRSGLAGRAVARRERVPRPAVRDAVHGLELYRANIAERMAAPQPRRTGVPVQVLAPTGDRYVLPELQTEIAAYASDLRVRRIPGGHWVPRHRPDVVARCVRELVTHVGGAPEAPSLRRARAGTGRWAGRLVVVTGAASGIGRATALAFARRGAEVVGVDRDEVDVSDAAAMEEFAKRVAAEHGVPDVVVNNAGIGIAGAFADTTLEDWHRIVDVNLWGVIHGCRLFFAQMREHGEGGHVVLAPVTPQAHVMLAMSRLTPGLLRAVARREMP